MTYIETHITEACNLRCRGCSHFSVFAKPKDKDIGEFEREFKRLAQLGNIDVIRLMGGEPLLNPDYMAYARIARACFPDSKIDIVTNGILADRITPNTAQLHALRIGITVSDYHIAAQDLYKLPYTTRHEKGVLYNICLDPTGRQNKAESFNRCDLHRNKWSFLKDGRIYACCIAGCIQDFWSHFGLDWSIDQKSLGIDIFTATAAEIEKFLDTPNELCRFCDTATREKSYRVFERSKGDIKEWTV